MEESKDEPGVDKCPFCKRGITDADRKQNKVNMLLSTKCYHQFHIPCFKEHVKTRLTTAKKSPSGEITFEDAVCGLCNKVISHDDFKENLTQEEMNLID